MKLQEFMNDDTCQILFAIIIGIVVCYFIFGSCGSCGSSGSCNRDGFSVGATCDTYFDEMITNCDEGDGNLTQSDLNPDLITDRCAQAVNSYTMARTRCVLDQLGSIDRLSVQDPQLTTELRQSIDRVIPRYNASPCESRAFSPATCGSRTVGVGPLPPLRVNCEINAEGDACIAVPAPAPAGAGGTAIHAASLTDPDSVAISLGPPPELIGTPGQVLLIQNIKRDVEYQVSRITGEDPPKEFSSIDEAKVWLQRFAPTIGNFVEFRILVNDKNLDGTPNLDRQYLVDNLDNIFQINMSMLSMSTFYNTNYIDTEYDPTSSVRDAKNKVNKMNLTNITDTYSSMTPNNKKEIYCNNYTLKSESDEYIDPLLKLISLDMMDPGTENITCPDSVPSLDPSIQNYTFPDGTYPNKNKLIIQIRDAIGDIRLINRETFGEAFGEDEISSTTPYNGSLYLDDSEVKKNANEIAIDIHSSQIPPPIVIRTTNTPTSTKKMLIGLNGLSNNNRDGDILRNSPYNNNIVIDTEKNGAGDKYNSDTNAYQIYLKNVFWLQYYFARMFMGTDRYIPFNNYRQLFDPPIDLFKDVGGDIRYSDNTIFPDFGRPEMEALNNQSCRDSGTDYLLLTTLQMSLYENALPMLTADIDRFLGVQDSLTNKYESGVREIANGLFIVDGLIKKITDAANFNRVVPVAPVVPVVAPRCNSKSFLFDTGQGCEWLDLLNGGYDHKNCNQFVARSAGPGGGYICEIGSRDGGVRQCQNGPYCAGPLPTQSGKTKDGL